MAKTTTADTAVSAHDTAIVASGRLTGKVALITGAAGNLGQAIARRYLAEAK